MQDGGVAATRRRLPEPPIMSMMSVPLVATGTSSTTATGAAPAVADCTSVMLSKEMVANPL
eukprot:9247903-Pyramimonas_sp.AAC.1